MLLRKGTGTVQNGSTLLDVAGQQGRADTTDAVQRRDESDRSAFEAFGASSLVRAVKFGTSAPWAAPPTILEPQKKPRSVYKRVDLSRAERVLAD